MPRAVSLLCFRSLPPRAPADARWRQSVEQLRSRVGIAVGDGGCVSQREPVYCVAPRGLAGFGACYIVLIHGERP